MTDPHLPESEVALRKWGLSWMFHRLCDMRETFLLQYHRDLFLTTRARAVTVSRVVLFGFFISRLYPDFQASLQHGSSENPLNQRLLYTTVFARDP